MIYVNIKIKNLIRKNSVFSNNKQAFVEFCDEKYFTNSKKGSILNIDFNQIHESV